jgi:hypothetical protein
MKTASLILLALLIGCNSPLPQRKRIIAKLTVPKGNYGTDLLLIADDSTYARVSPPTYALANVGDSLRVSEWYE